MTKIRYWTTAVAFILLLGSMGRPQEVLASPDPDFTTAEWNGGVHVALLTDRPESSGIHNTGQPKLADAESDLDHIIVNVSHPESDIAHDTPGTFVGRIAVHTRPSH